MDTTFVRYKAVQGSISLRSKYYYYFFGYKYFISSGIIFDSKFNEIVRPFWNSILTIYENKHLHYIGRIS